MKKIILLSFFLLPLLSMGSRVFAQTEGIPIEYSAVVQADGIEASELFARAQTWLARSYNSGKHVLQMADNNRLVGKANIPYEYDCGGMYGKANAESNIRLQSNAGMADINIRSTKLNYLFIRNKIKNGWMEVL